MDMWVHSRAAASGRGIYGIGGVAGLTAAVLGAIANVLHPRVADLGDTEELLISIADSPSWRLVHLAIVASVALGFIFLAALSRSLDEQPGAHPALVVAVGTGALTMASFALDGFAFSRVAQEWVEASGSARS